MNARKEMSFEHSQTASYHVLNKKQLDSKHKNSLTVQLHDSLAMCYT